MCACARNFDGCSRRKFTAQQGDAGGGIDGQRSLRHADAAQEGNNVGFLVGDGEFEGGVALFAAMQRVGLRTATQARTAMGIIAPVS